ncbi:MAG: 2OG-Fe(II) oxygenase [bacterium]
MIDLLELPGFLATDECAAIREALSSLAGGAATVLSPDAHGSVAPSVRRTTRLACPAELSERIQLRLMSRKAEIEAHFDVALSSCESAQFLRYETGDFFVPHQDGNTPLVHDHSRFRRVSVVIFLSTASPEPTPETYGGGSLVFHGSYTEPTPTASVNPDPGTLIAFRSETTHEVTAVTHGERYTIVSWFRG